MNHQRDSGKPQKKSLYIFYIVSSNSSQVSLLSREKMSTFLNCFFSSFNLRKTMFDSQIFKKSKTPYSFEIFEVYLKVISKYGLTYNSDFITFHCPKIAFGHLRQ